MLPAMDAKGVLVLSMLLVQAFAAMLVATRLLCRLQHEPWRWRNRSVWRSLATRCLETTHSVWQLGHTDKVASSLDELRCRMLMRLTMLLMAACLGRFLVCELHIAFGPTWGPSPLEPALDLAAVLACLLCLVMNVFRHCAVTPRSLDAWVT